jgi:hypothetical protein
MAETAATKKVPEGAKGQPVFDFNAHPLTHDTLHIKWTETPLFINARLATNDDVRLTSSYFTDRANKWPPGSRDAFLSQVAKASGKRLDLLFNYNVLDAIPKTATWDKDTVSLWLHAVLESESPEIMLNDKFITRMNGWPNQLRKALFGTMSTTHEHKLLSDDTLLDRVELLSKENLGDACGYLWHMGATKSIITIDEFRKIQQAKFL